MPANQQHTRVIALDVGDKRIGVALSDGSRMIAAPLQTVKRKNMKTDVARIADLVQREDAGEIVIGLPLTDDTEGAQALKARSFGKQLARACGLPVHFEDERLSTFTAIEILVAQGIKTGHNRDLVDMHAAAVILQSFLDDRRRDNHQMQD